MSTCFDMMAKHPGVQKDALSVVQWLQRMMHVNNTSTWGGDLELRLLAIGLKRDIVVKTVVTNNCVCEKVSLSSNTITENKR